MFLTIEGNTAIKDSLFVTVGDKAITKSDVIDEVKLILILNGRSFSEEKREILRTAALQSLIKRNIKKIEIEKYDYLDFDPIELDFQINSIAKNLNMELDILKGVFESNGIDFQKIIDQVKIELKWNTLIFQLYKNKLSINIK